MSVGT